MEWLKSRNVPVLLLIYQRRKQLFVSYSSSSSLVVLFPKMVWYSMVSALFVQTSFDLREKMLSYLHKDLVTPVQGINSSIKAPIYICSALCFCVHTVSQNGDKCKCTYSVFVGLSLILYDQHWGTQLKFSCGAFFSESVLEQVSSTKAPIYNCSALSHGLSLRIM